MRRTLFVLALAALPALQPALADEPAAAQSDRDKYMEEGARAYNTGKWDKAIESWQKGYEVTGDPDFLYNLGQAFRKNNDYGNAITNFKSFLRERPESDQREAIEQRIEEMENLLIEQQQANQRPPDGIGAALLVTGGVFGVMAMGNKSDLEDAAAAGEPWTANQDLEDERSRNVTISTVCLAAGGAALIGGGIMYFVGRSKAKHAESVSVIPTLSPDGGNVNVLVRW
jgi:tetratricopeptide (TPR) repeat protein